MQILIPGNRAVQYTGEHPRRLWEVGGAEAPNISNGSIIVVPILTARLLVRKDFEYYGDDAPIITVDAENSVIASTAAAVKDKGKNIVDAVKDMVGKL